LLKEVVGVDLSNASPLQVPHSGFQIEGNGDCRSRIHQLRAPVFPLPEKLQENVSSQGITQSPQRTLGPAFTKAAEDEARVLRLSGVIEAGFEVGFAGASPKIQPHRGHTYFSQHPHGVKDVGSTGEPFQPVEDQDQRTVGVRVRSEIQVQEVIIRGFPALPLQWEIGDRSKILSPQGLEMSSRKPPSRPKWTTSFVRRPGQSTSSPDAESQGGLSFRISW
jgi:hypothetical protein